LNASGEASRTEAWPTVSVVFLAYNRRDELRHSLKKTLEELDYDGDRLETIVVDNASTDGTSEMLASEFPNVDVIRRSWNCGVSGFNDGFAAATGDYVLALDDDAWLPPDGLRRAVDETGRHRADLVSFGVESAEEGGYRFDLDEYRTGLFSFWGCAVLARREVLRSLVGYDPEIFVWGNELEFMLRFFDHGFRHLYLPKVVALHAKPPGEWRGGPFPERAYRVNTRNFGYIAAKLLSRRDAAEALMALLAQNVVAGVRTDTSVRKALVETVRGFRHGLRHRQPVRREVSRAYRQNFETFSSPWWVSRSPSRIARDAIRPGRAERGDRGRREQWLAERARFYPTRGGVLEFRL
jgi:GT2 family glycosyltransferase